MQIKDNVIQVLYEVIDDVNKMLHGDQRLEKSVDTVIYGETGALDSLGLINFIVTLEQRIESDLGISINLSDDDSLLEDNGPLESIGRFADYIVERLHGESGG